MSDERGHNIQSIPKPPQLSREELVAAYARLEAILLPLGVDEFVGIAFDARPSNERWMIIWRAVGATVRLTFIKPEDSHMHVPYGDAPDDLLRAAVPHLPTLVCGMLGARRKPLDDYAQRETLDTVLTMSSLAVSTLRPR